MNNTRRREIKKVINELNDIKNTIRIINIEIIRNKMENCSSNLLSIQMDEQFAFDNMPEGLQYSERGETIEENAGILEDCVDIIEDLETESDVDEIIDSIDEIIENLEDIIL